MRLKNFTNSVIQTITEHPKSIARTLKAILLKSVVNGRVKKSIHVFMVLAIR
jgi:hypothetical protein